MKESLHKFSAFWAQYAFHDLDLMIQNVGVRQSKFAAYSAEAEIACAEHQTEYTRRH